MNVKRLLYGRYSEYILAIILGFGLATLFRKACKDRSCLIFKGPKVDKMSNKTFKYDSKCYTFTPEIGGCHEKKQTIDFA